MKFHVLIFTSGIFSCVPVFAQDTLSPDSVVLATDFGIKYPRHNDSVLTSHVDTAHTLPLVQDTGICVSIPIQITYTVIVTEPNPCVDPALLSSDYGSAPLDIVFIDIPSDRTYPWFTSWSSFGSIGCWSIEYQYKSWHEINLFDTTPKSTSRIGLAATRAMEISTVPPSETPEPAKPVPLPKQPWYQAVLPTPIRIRKG